MMRGTHVPRGSVVDSKLGFGRTVFGLACIYATLDNRWTNVSQSVSAQAEPAAVNSITSLSLSELCSRLDVRPQTLRRLPRGPGGRRDS